MSEVSVDQHLAPLYKAILAGEPVLDTLLHALHDYNAKAVAGMLFAKSGPPLSDDDMAQLLDAIEGLSPSMQEEALAGLLVGLGPAAEDLLTRQAAQAVDPGIALLQAACAGSADGAAVRAALVADKHYRDARAEADTCGVLHGICTLRLDCAALTGLVDAFVSLMGTEASLSEWRSQAEALLGRARELLGPADASWKTVSTPTAEQIAAAASILTRETAQGPAATRAQHLREVVQAVGAALAECQAQPLRYPASKRMLHDVLHAACSVCRDVIAELGGSLEILTRALTAHVDTQLELPENWQRWKAAALPLAEKVEELRDEQTRVLAELYDKRRAMGQAMKDYEECLQRAEAVQLAELKEKLAAARERHTELTCCMITRRKPNKAAGGEVNKLLTAFNDAVPAALRVASSAPSEDWLEQLRSLCAQVPDRLPEVCTVTNLPGIIAQFSGTNFSNTAGWQAALASTAIKAHDFSEMCQGIDRLTSLTGPSNVQYLRDWLNAAAKQLDAMERDLVLIDACTNAVKDEPSCTTALLLAFKAMLDTRMFMPGLQRFAQAERAALQQLVTACTENLSKLECPLQLYVLSSASVAYSMLGYDEGQPRDLLTVLTSNDMKRAASRSLTGAATDQLFRFQELMNTSKMVPMLQNAPSSAVQGDAQLQQIASEHLVLKECKQEWLLSHLRPLRTDLGPNVLKYPGACCTGPWLLLTRLQGQPSRPRDEVPRCLFTLAGAAAYPQARQDVARSLVQTYNALKTAWESLASASQRQEVAHCLSLMLLSPAEFAVVQREGRYTALLTTTGGRIRAASEAVDQQVFVHERASAEGLPPLRNFLHPAISGPEVTWGSIQPAECGCSYLARTAYAIGATVLQLLGVRMDAVNHRLDAWEAGGAAVDKAGLDDVIKAASIDPAHSDLADTARGWLLVTRAEALADVEEEREEPAHLEDSVSEGSWTFAQAESVISRPAY